MENYIGKLQEHQVKNGQSAPKYTDVDKKGLEHTPTFKCRVFLSNGDFADSSYFPTKQEAKNDAARVMLEKINLDSINRLDKGKWREIQQNVFDVLYCLRTNDWNPHSVGIADDVKSEVFGVLSAMGITWSVDEHGNYIFAS